MSPDEEKKGPIEEKKGAEENESNEDEPQIPAHILEKMPKEARQLIMSYMGPAPHPLTKRITSEHITKLIENSNKDSERDHQSESERRRFNLIVFVVAIIAAIGIIVFMVIMKERNVLINILIGILGFAGGFGVGKLYKRD